ncbi:MAG: helix-turn-helix transcriptional regulator [Thermoflexaceae bacterium]|nr:helix-turn-helix transcriptional regulator [Thermoflexaceae bacterium]
MTEKTSFARWLERELASRRVNRSQLAAYMGRRAQTVSAWFNDGRLPSTEVCADLARVLHVPLEEVLRQAGHLPPEPEYPEPEPHSIPEALRLLRR